MDEHQADTSPEQWLREQLLAAHDPAAPYDYLVMFSGGKDSSYLAHWLKSAPGGRVCLLSVDNGFQSDGARAALRANASALGCDLYVYQRPAEDFRAFYGTVLRESAALLRLSPQPMCTCCHAYLQGAALAFADRLGIPIVAQGLTFAQLTFGRARPGPREAAAYAMFNRLFVEKIQRAVTTLPAFAQQPRLRPLAATMGHRPQRARLVQPFWFLDRDVPAIKRMLIERYGWRSPIPEDAGAEFLATSCRLGELLDLLTARLGYGAELERLLAADKGLAAPEELARRAGPAAATARRARQQALLEELGVRDLLPE